MCRSNVPYRCCRRIDSYYGGGSSGNVNRSRDSTYSETSRPRSKCRARFIVSPGFDPEIVDYCLAKGILVLPGCITPSEVAQAVKRGLEVVKFFPAEQFGGIATLKALSAPYVNVRFMPTGWISAKNLKDYLSFKKIIACGGSWMVKSDLIEAGKFDEIKAMISEAITLVKEIKEA